MPMDQTPPPGTTPAYLVITWVDARAEEGTICPGCQRHVKVHQYPFEQHWVDVCAHVHCSPDEWVYLPDLADEGQKEALIRHWKLLRREETFNRHDGNPRTGYYGDTQLNADFLAGLIEIPRTIKIFDDGFIGYLDPNDLVDVHKIYGRYFDLALWRYEHPIEPDTSNRRNTFRHANPRGRARTIDADGYDLNMTLDQVREWVDEHSLKGCKCPICEQYYKTYRRGLTPLFARTLMMMKYDHEHGTPWVRLTDPRFKSKGKEASQMKHWPLIEQGPNYTWRLTSTGWGVTRNTLTVPRAVLTLNGEFLRYVNDNDRVNCRSVLGAFRYDQMLHGEWEQ